ncbi:MAG: sodium:solute symporter family protein [Acidobacteria bacterium]|nr:sodium:solute symporter family protein [Acidobacteriota bacterium]
MDIYIWSIAVYLAFLIGISAYRSRRIKTQDDFMVAGRAVPMTMLVGTLVCTWIGSGSLFGGAGRAFREGFSALWMSAGAWVGIAIVYFLAPKVRRIAQYTVPDILETRYTPAARLLGSFAIIIAYLTIANYQFKGGGRLLNILVPSIDPNVGAAITCGLVVLFTVLAGMMSIVSVDLLNGIMITLAILIAAPLILSSAGGWEGLTVTLPATHFTLVGRTGIAQAMGLFFPTFFLLMGESGMYQKFMGAKDALTARRAVIGMIIGVIVVETVLDATAIFGAGIYWNDPAYRAADGTFNSGATETIILQLARHDLAPVFGILLLIGGVAIIFSTANSFLMIPSTNVARDIYQRFINPKADEKKIILVQRVMIVILALAAYVASTFFESILDMALYAYTMVGAAVTPALLAAFLWRRVTALGGTLSIAAGVGTSMLFALLNQLGVDHIPLGFTTMPLDYEYAIYPAALASFLSLIIGSLMTPPSPEEKWRPFWPEKKQEA